MTVIVFSKDRAMQLDAFLRSYHYYVPSGPSPFVLYLATSERHAQAYNAVFSRSRLSALHQGFSFKESLLSLLPSDGPLAFFVDDQVFVRPWDASATSEILSLRLGLNIRRNYLSNDALQDLPPFRPLDSQRITWKWGEGMLAWQYPLSLDGHVFDASIITPLIRECDFHSPNTLESALQHFAPRFHDLSGACYWKSKVVNIPWNIVQTDWTNRHADGATADELLTLWEEGYQIDLTPYCGIDNTSVHQELALSLEPRV